MIYVVDILLICVRYRALSPHNAESDLSVALGMMIQHPFVEEGMTRLFRGGCRIVFPNALCYVPALLN